MEESLYLLIPISLLLVFIIGVMFWWALRSGQYDDLEGPAYRILFDDQDELGRKEEENTGTAEENRFQKP